MNWSTIFDELADETKASRHVTQGSEEWDRIRIGRFTASEIHRLLSFGKRLLTDAELKARPKTGKGSKITTVTDYSVMGEAGLSYVKEKVAEILTGQPRNSSYAYPLVYGKETETEAVEFFEKRTGLECEEIGFVCWGDYAGGSPDRKIVSKNEGLEIKCPWQSDNQIDYLELTDLFDLKRLKPDYYYQCVSNMLFTGFEKWHFATYDPRMIDDRHKMAHIEIQASSEEVKADMDLITKALEVAVKELLSTLQRLRS